jgi:hypothetical protein
MDMASKPLIFLLSFLKEMPKRFRLDLLSFCYDGNHIKIVVRLVDMLHDRFFLSFFCYFFLGLRVIRNGLFSLIYDNNNSFMHLLIFLDAKVGILIYYHS